MPVKNKKTTTHKKSNSAQKSLKKKQPVKKAAAKKKVSPKKPVKKTTSKPSIKKSAATKKPAAKKNTSVKKKKTMPTKAVKKTMTSKVKTNKKAVAKKPQPKVNKVVKKSLPKKPAKSSKPAARAVPKQNTVSKAKEPKLKAAATTPKKLLTTQSELVKKTAVAPKTPDVKKISTAGQTTSKSTGKSGVGPAGFSPYEPKKGEEYMNDTQLAHFQHVLNLWKEQLYADRDATTQHMRDDTINFPDPLDRAALEEEHTLEWRAREREHRLIAKIDQALTHIKQGDYGYCEGCGAEIGIRRLEARPTATQCIDCKTINEIREKHIGTVE